MNNIGYYVSMKDGGKTALLLGPYSEHTQPLNRVDAARECVGSFDAWSHFYSFGTCKIETDKALPLGSLNKRELLPL